MKKTNDGTTTLIKGWRKVTYDDIKQEGFKMYLSKATLDIVDTKAKELNMYRSEFIEIAITSTKINSASWELAQKRYETSATQRESVKKLRRKAARCEKLPHPSGSSARRMFDDIVARERAAGFQNDRIE